MANIFGYQIIRRTQQLRLHKSVDWFLLRLWQCSGCLLNPEAGRRKSTPVQFMKAQIEIILVDLQQGASSAHKHVCKKHNIYVLCDWNSYLFWALVTWNGWNITSVSSELHLPFPPAFGQFPVMFMEYQCNSVEVLQFAWLFWPIHPLGTLSIWSCSSVFAGCGDLSPACGPVGRKTFGC